MDTDFSVITPGPSSEAEIQQRLSSIWKDLQDNPDLLTEHGIKHNKLPPDCPFAPSQKEGQEGLAAAILIAVASEFAKDLAADLWNTLIWPELKRKLPGLVQTKAPSADGSV